MLAGTRSASSDSNARIDAAAREAHDETKMLTRNDRGRE
jgi:hypothetical protein